MIIETLTRRKTIHARVANKLVDIGILTPPAPGTPVDFTGYAWECEVNTKPDGSGTKLADATVTVTGHRIEVTLTIAQSNAIVAGAINGVVYADLLGAASGEEPQKIVSLTCPTSGTVTTWGA